MAYQGQGEVAAVAEEGFDLGNAEDVHTAFHAIRDPADAAVPGNPIASRVLAVLGAPGSDLRDKDGHGTLVAGILLGDSELGEGIECARGSAPRAKLVVQAFMAPDANELTDLLRAAYTGYSARVTNISQGVGFDNDLGQGTYDSGGLARACDAYVRLNWDLVIVAAAGNEGHKISDNGAHICGLQSAKNIITVGATQSSRPNGHPDVMYRLQ